MSSSTASVQFEKELAQDTFKSVLAESFKLTQLMNQMGIQRPIPTQERLAHIAGLPSSAQEKIRRHLRELNDLCELSVENEWPALDDLRLTWYAIRKMNLRGPESLFSMIKNTDCIEVYDKNGIQMYRNFQFCTTCSYSIEDLLTMSWEELYNRPSEIFGMMLNEAGEVLTKTKEPITSRIPDHEIVEKKSPKRRRVQVKFRVTSPLFGPDGSTEAFLATSELETLIG